MATEALFQPLWDGYSVGFSGGRGESVARAIGTATPYLQGALGLYVIISGVLIALGSMTYAEGAKRCVRALLVAALLTPATYNEWVVNLFTQTIPDLISNSSSGGDVGSAVRVFDQLYAADEAMLAQALATAGSNPFNIGKVVSAYFAAGLAEIALVVAFLLWSFSLNLVSIVVCIGPYIIPFWLFNATRNIPERFFGKLIGIMVLLAMVLITNQIIQFQERNYISAYSSLMVTPDPGAAAQPRTGFVGVDGSYIDPGEFGATGGVTGGGVSLNLDRAVSILWKVAMAFLFGTLLLLAMPSVAAYIGGGVAVSSAPMIMAMARRAGI